MIRLKDHMTEGLTAARLRMEARRALRPLLVVAIAAAIGVSAAAVLITNANRTWFKGSETIRFAVSDATAVQPGQNQVRFKGIPIGTITAVQLQGDHAVLSAVVQKRYGTFYRDAQAALRPATALQDMYLDILDRGTARAGAASTGVPLPVTRTTTAVNVADVLNTFDVGERERVRQLLDNLGNGLQDRGVKLRQAFVETIPLLRSAGRITDQIAARRTQTKRLVHNISLLTDELGRREALLRRLVGDGSIAASTFAAGSRDLDAVLRELPPSVSSLQGGLRSLRAVLPDVDSAVSALAPVADVVPRALDDLQRISRDASPALAALREPVERLAPVAADLRPVSHHLDAAVSQLRPQADTTDLVTKRAAGCKKGIQDFFQWNTSMTKFGDANGPFPRGNFVLGGSSELARNPWESAPPACTPGRPIGGRPPTQGEIFGGTR